MLRGYFRVGNLEVELRGYDYITNYKFYLSCAQKHQRHIDKGYRFTDEMGEEIVVPSTALWGAGHEPLYFVVTEDAVSVAKYISPIKGDRTSNEVSKGFFTVLGSLLSGCKTMCTKQNTVGYTEAFGLDQTADATQAHVIENIVLPDKKHSIKYIAYVERKRGKIQSIKLGTDETPYELVLEEDHGYNEIIQKTTNTLHKFVLDKSKIFKDLKQVKKTRKKEVVDEDNVALEDFLLSFEEIQDNHPERNYEWLKGRDYKIVSDIDEVKKICAEIMAHDGIVSFDTETTGLNFTFEGMQGQGDKLVGMVFSIREGQSWYFPVRHKAIQNICDESNEYNIITTYFKPILEQKKILCHNGSFDEKVMFRYGIQTNLCEDTMVILRLSLSLEDKNAPYSLKGATRLYLGRDSYELEDLVATKKWQFDFADLPYEYVRLYACADTDNTLTLYHWIKNNRIFDKYDLYNVYYNIELPFTSVVAYSEYWGMIVDMDRAEELDKKMHAICDKEEKEIYRLAGHDFKISSPNELREVLFDEMGCPPQGYTDSGCLSTDKSVVKKLAKMTDEKGNPRYPICVHLQEYRDASKMISSFTNLLNGKAKSDNNISKTGVISSSVQPFLETSRVSVNKPNYQSFNDTVKRYIVPREGYYMIDADYSSVEYRITASMSGQEELIQAFFDPDTDYHKLKASLMYRIPYEDVTPEMRRKAKSFNFGIPYGMGIPSLAELLFGNKNPESIAEATQLYNMYFEGQEKVRDFFTNGRAEGWINGRSRTYFGGYRYYDKTVKNQAKIEKESGNHKIQGTAANIYKMAMADLYRKIRERGWWGKVLISGFIHDECLLEASCDINPAIVMAELRDSMMLDIEGWCPLYTGMGCGANWDDAKHIEIPTQLQEELVSKYGKTGFPWWKGDSQELYDNMKQFIYDYKRDRVLNYMRNPENHGTTLPLVEDDLAHEVISAVNAGKYTNGVVDPTPKPDHDLLTNLKNFCHMFGEDDLFASADMKPRVKRVVKEDVQLDLKNIKPDVFESMSRESQQEYLSEAVDAYGLYCEQGTDRVYITIDNKPFFGVAKRNFAKDGDYEVWFMSKDWGKPKKSKFRIDGEDYSVLQQTYINLNS